MFEGTTVALITPFDEEGKPDLATVKALSRWHLESGTDGILVAGCTGESFTLSDAERLDIFEAVREEVGERMHILLGTGATSTEIALRRTEAAREAGADGALVITPYGNKPTQHALLKYYRELAEVGIPLVLYNVPGRTGCCISPETAAELARNPNIVAIKEASGSLDAVSRILASSELAVLSGDDSLTVGMISLGASGVVATLANLLPGEFSKMVRTALSGDFRTAAELHLQMFPVMKGLFIEGNPVPLKTAMEYAGVIPSSRLRPPLTPMTEENRQKLFAILDRYGINR